MYRVLIADDEPWVAMTVSKLISWEALGFQICGTAENAYEAWAMLEQKKPHLLISDIRMPEMDGITLMKKMRKQEIPAEVILISGYEEFEYAREAIRLGVSDYLSKPINRQELTAAVEKVKATLERKQQAEPQQENYLANLSEVLLSGKKTDIAAFMADKGIVPALCDYAYAIVRSEEKLHWAKKLCRNRQAEAVCIRTGENTVSVAMAFSGNAEHALTSVCWEILPEVTPRTHYFAGLSRTDSGSGDLRRLNDEADISLWSELFLPGKGIRSYQPFSNAVVSQIGLPAVMGYAKAHNTEKIMDWVEQLANACRNGTVLLDGLVDVSRQLRHLHQKYYESAQSGAFAAQVKDYRELYEMYGDGEIYFAELKAAFSKTPQHRYVVEHKLIADVLQEIRSCYMQSLSIQEIGKRCGISQGYLSNLIKQETGLTFTEHVTACRIEEANRLLRNTEKSIVEISEKVGYTDYNYFSKVYKKVCGMTPGEYRRISLQT